MKIVRVFTPCLWALLIISCAAESLEDETESESTSSESETVSIKQDNGYIFTCPRSLKTGATNELQLRLYGDNALPAGHLAVLIYYQDSFTSNESIAVEKHYAIDEGAKNSFLELYIPKFDNYVYNGRIDIKGDFGGYNISGSDKVYFSVSKDFLILIQTDKPLYKEGQKVQFRVLSLKKDLKPLANTDAEIYVEDPKGNKLNQWKTNLGQGMKQFEFPLADEPLLGDWKISVKVLDEDTSTTFEVKEYVLPKFSVKIEIPSYVLANAEEIPIKVCAKYTYGKSVKGTLKMNISLETFSWSNEKIPNLEREEKIDGCFDYNINVSLIETDDYYRYRRIQVNVGVLEEGTGIQINETQYIQRQYSPLNLNFNTEQRQFYKPGLPYNGKLSVNNPDNTPAKDEGIQICYTVSRERILSNWWAKKKVKVCSNFTSDENGSIEYIIPPQSTDSVGITVDAISLKYVKKDQGTHRQNALSQPQTSMSLTPWYSPSGSFMQLQPVQETLYCGINRKFTFLFTSKQDKHYSFHYQVLNQGSVVQSGVVEKTFSTEDDMSSKYEDESKLINRKQVQLVPPIESSRLESPEEECPSAREARYVPPVGEASIELEIDPSWSPTFYLLVYHILDSRETVADSQKFKVEQCFKNQVKLQFGDAVKQPATKTSIRVSASPNSLCGIKVVDKSVSLLNSEDQLTKEKVFRILESFDTGMYYGVNHCNEDVPQPGLYRSDASSILPPRPPRPWSSSSYEDSLAAFENAGFLVISDLKLFLRPCKSRGNNNNIVYDESAAYQGYGGGQAVAMASTARRPRPPAAVAAESADGVRKKTGVEATKSVVEVRSYFPDTWLFNMEMTDNDGEYITKEKLPHTITEWIGSAVCISENDGLGISNETSIQGFQAFFLSFTLPYSVIRGEQFEVTISVFSYVEDPLPITVSLGALEGLEVTSEAFDKDICIQPGSSTNIKLQLKGTSIGKQNITVQGETSQNSDACGSVQTSDAIAKDAVENSVIVEAEGYKAEDTRSMLICPKDSEDESLKKQFLLSVPDDIVPDSGRAFLDCTGNILGKSLDNLDNLVALPTGCGEQNMVKLAPNIMALELLTDTGTQNMVKYDKLTERIKKNIILGTQRQLNYAHPDGSFSAFGTRDKEGSMFLTAFVLQYFCKADKFVSIDNSTIVRMQNYIESKQKEDGCFPNDGRIFDTGIQGAIENEKGLGPITAYVLSSLLVCGYQNQTVLDSAFSCLQESQDKTFYATFLYAHAEALAGKQDSAKEKLLAVKEKVITKDGAEYYHDVNATKSQDVETNAYAILANLESGGSASESLPTLQYLIQNLNPNGGFHSTQDTCVGIQALAKFSKSTFKEPVNIKLTVSGGGLEEKDITIDEDNKLIVQRNKIPEVPSEVAVTASGTGCAVVQSVVRYNTKAPPEKRSFNLDIIAACKDDKCSRATIKVSVSYIPEGKRTGMSLVEIKMITGVSPVQESLAKLKEDSKLGIMRTDFENNVVIIYCNEISNSPINFSLDVEKVVAVEKAQPGTVKVYDYYNRDLSSSSTYSLGNCEETSSCSKDV